ncbi:hypothetical protein MTP99_011396 [Tenebrio molitor]|jgi:hypothetical protein|nr:hypothetical protein MTP99_011396 [Tenebrio molitor]
MLQIWSLLAIFFAVQTAGDTSVEITVVQRLNLLEDDVYFPINLHLSSLTRLFETLITNFTNYDFDANGIIETHLENVQEDVDTISQALEEYQIDMTDCLENLAENLDQTRRRSAEEIKDEIVKGVEMGQKVISNVREVFMMAQNKTVEIKLEVQNCLSLLDDTDCLMEALGKIHLLQHILPLVIDSAEQQHQMQLAAVEDDVIGALEKIVSKALNIYVELLDDFLICTLQSLNTFL